MARRLRTKTGRADYARRKAIVEPDFGQMKVRQAAGHLRLGADQGPARGEQGRVPALPARYAPAVCSRPVAPHA